MHLLIQRHTHTHGRTRTHTLIWNVHDLKKALIRGEDLSEMADYFLFPLLSKLKTSPSSGLNRLCGYLVTE